MQVVMIGPFMLKFSLLMLAASAVLGYLAPFLLARRVDPAVRKPVMDDLTTALLIGILVWKFSFIVFDIQSVIRSPLSLLYYTGGTEGMALAAAVAFLIPAYKCLKYRRPWAVYANTALAWLAAGDGIWNLLRVFSGRGGAVDIVSGAVAALIVAYQFRQRERLFSGYHFIVSVLWLAIGMFAASLLGAARDEAFWLGFTGWQLSLMFIMVLSLAVKIMFDFKSKSNRT
ncbi:hypothetical protein NYE48_11985 [Paenibacillus sp. FSL M7-1455]|uniref:hypothetical protein n=1 Tax=Paenibacillus sp. FSL M7-1455 TaxID=2975316 RepID=UPI0030F81DD2